MQNALTLTIINNKVPRTLVNSVMYDDYYVSENTENQKHTDYVNAILTFLSVIVVISGIWLLMPVIMCIQSIAIQIFEVSKNMLNRIKCG